MLAKSEVSMSVATEIQTARPLQLARRAWPIGVGMLLAAGCAPTGAAGSATDAADASGSVGDAGAAGDGAKLGAADTAAPPPCPIKGQWHFGGVCKDYCEEDACPADQACAVGTQSACKTIACQLPAVTSARPVWKVIDVTLPKAAALDGLPLPHCDFNADGVHDLGFNVAAQALLPAINDSAAKYLATGEFIRLFDAHSPTADGKAFAVDGLGGTAAAKACYMTSANGNCPLHIAKESYHLDAPGTCQPLSTCTGHWTDGKLTIDCPGATPQPVFAKPKMGLPAYHVAFAGTMTVAGAADLVTCGYFRKQDLLDALAAVPDEKLSATDGSGSVAKGMTDSVNSLLSKPDVDSDGDGKNDAFGFAAKVMLAPAQVVP